MNKISVIVPVYNMQRWLEECIESIRSQTHQNLEIILVNDGSTDSSLEICQQYAVMDERIIVIDKPNGGVSQALNYGLDKATGAWSIIVSSDDVIEPDMFEKLLTSATQHQANIAVCGIKVFSNETDFSNQVVHSKKVLSIEDALGYVTEGILISPCTKLYHKDLIKQLRFDENRRFGEDYLFAIQSFLLQGVSVSNVSEALYHHKKRPGAGSVATRLTSHLERFQPESHLAAAALVKPVSTDIYTAMLGRLPVQAASIIVHYLKAGGNATELEHIKATVKHYVPYTLRSKRLSTKLKLLTVATLLFPKTASKIRFK